MLTATSQALADFQAQAVHDGQTSDLLDGKSRTRQERHGPHIKQNVPKHIMDKPDRGKQQRPSSEATQNVLKNIKNAIGRATKTKTHSPNMSGSRHLPHPNNYRHPQR